MIFHEAIRRVLRRLTTVLWRAYVYAFVFFFARLPKGTVDRKFVIEDVVNSEGAIFTPPVRDGFMQFDMQWDSPQASWLEVRYRWRGDRYRMFHDLQGINELRIPWPPYDQVTMMRPRGFRRRFLAALATSEVDGRSDIVSHIVREYAGPFGDFHKGVGSPTRVAHMLPQFDPKCHLLVMVDTFNQQQVLTFDQAVGLSG